MKTLTKCRYSPACLQTLAIRVVEIWLTCNHVSVFETLNVQGMELALYLQTDLLYLQACMVVLANNTDILILLSCHMTSVV